MSCTNNILQKYKKEVTIFITIVGLSLLLSYLQLNFFKSPDEYDQARDLNIIKDIYLYNSFSYYGDCYFINPPLWYYIRAYFLKFIGKFDYFSLVFLEYFIFLLSIFPVYKFLEYILNRSLKFYEILLVLVYLSTSTFYIFIGHLRWYSVLFLLGSSILYVYFLSIRNNKYIILLSILFPISFFIKHSFFYLFFGIILVDFLYYYLISKKYYELFKRLIVLLISTLPFFIYSFYVKEVSGLYPWEHNKFSLRFGESWLKNEKRAFYFTEFLPFILFFPAEFFISLYLFTKRVKNKQFDSIFFLFLTFLVTISIITIVFPFMHINKDITLIQFLLSVFKAFIRNFYIEMDIHIIYFLSPILSTIFLYFIFKNRKAKSSYIFLFLYSVFLFYFSIEKHSIDPKDFLKVINLSNNLADENALSLYKYNMINVFSKSLVEVYINNSILNIFYNIKYIISDKPLHLHYLEFVNKYNIEDKVVRLYKVNLSILLDLYNFTYIGYIKVNINGISTKGVKCYLVRPINLAIPFISNGKGVINIYLPKYFLNFSSYLEFLCYYGRYIGLTKINKSLELKCCSKKCLGTRF